MKHLGLLTFFCFIVMITHSQVTVTPIETTEFCPGVDITFTVTAPGTSTPTLSSSTNSPIIVQQAYGFTRSGGNTTFNFVGRFHDLNLNQAFRVTYKNSNNDDVFKDLVFDRVKSLYQSSDCAKVPNGSISIARCEAVTFTLNTAAVKWGNQSSNPATCFGSISDFDYQLPNNWSIGNFTSNGSNWYSGGSSVNITSDASGGHLSTIKIRPRTSCINGFANNQVPGEILITRPRANISISGDDYICSSSKTYSISGTPASGSTFCWEVSNTNYASISGSNCGSSVSVAYTMPGIIALKATVTDCIEPSGYPLVPLKIMIGATAGGEYEIASNYHSPNERELYPNNSTIWLPANEGFGVIAWLTSPGLNSATWTRKSTSYPFTWNTSPTNMNDSIQALSFSGSSGSTAYNQRNGIFTLSASTVCGNYSADYTWPIIVQGWSSFSMSISPNPVVDNATLSITEESPEVKALSTNEDVDIYLIDATSGLILKRWKFKNNQRQFRLNFNGIRHGAYLLKATIGKYESAKQIIVGNRN